MVFKILAIESSIFRSNYSFNRKPTQCDVVFCYMKRIFLESAGRNWLYLTIINLQVSPLLIEAGRNPPFRGIQNSACYNILIFIPRDKND